MIEDFGQMPDGQVVQRVTLSGGGLTAAVLSYGAIIQDLRLEGHDAPLVLGFQDFDPYLTDSPYFGAIAGRYANRIRNGHLELDGVTHQLDCNFLGKHLLHGGANGVGKRLWSIERCSENRVTLRIHDPAGHMGFPGNLICDVTYTLQDDATLDVEIEATTDAATLCNFAHHSYFNLDGSGSTQDHELWVDADRYLPVDEELIPTGERRPVAGTKFDFTEARAIGQAAPLDHNFCLGDARVPIRKVAQISSARSGLAMNVLTTEPGLQVYDGAKINVAKPGLTGDPMSAHAGIALEPQIWPDANHHDHFPQAILRPGAVYKQHTQYAFARMNE